MSALWDDPPYVDNPASSTPAGKFMVTHLDKFDYDETRLKVFDTLEEAVKYAEKRQSKAPDTLTAHRVWDDKGKIVARFDP